MIWKTWRLFVASRPATTITSIATSQPDIQAAAFLGKWSKDMGMRRPESRMPTFRSALKQAVGLVFDGCEGRI